MTKENLFKQLFTDTKHRLYGFLYGILRNEQQVQDCMQQCYMKLWEVMDTIDTKRDVLPLLYTYSRNLAIDSMRRNARYVWVDNLAVFPSPVNEDVSARKEQEEELQAVLNQMPPHRRQVFMLIKIHGYTYKEAAANLNIALSTVEKHMHEAHKFLAGIERPVSL